MKICLTNEKGKRREIKATGFSFTGWLFSGIKAMMNGRILWGLFLCFTTFIPFIGLYNGFVSGKRDLKHSLVDDKYVPATASDFDYVKMINYDKYVDMEIADRVQKKLQGK